MSTIKWFCWVDKYMWI